MGPDLVGVLADDNLEQQVGGAEKLQRLRAVKAALDPTDLFSRHPFVGLWTDGMPDSVLSASRS